jgi:hypothetical protein
MERRFNLIKSDFEKHEKRVLPRFPFCYLTFKPNNSNKVFEIKDISHSGMQLSFKDDEHEFTQDSHIKGNIHWLGQHMEIKGEVKWLTAHRMGIEFAKNKDVTDRIKAFLDLSEIVKKLKPLHKVEGGLEIPARLKYWLRSDGPVELFVWQHGDGEISKFQALYLETFIEWEDGNGIKSGRIISKRNVDSPLINEDEWLFKIDADLDGEKMEKVKELVSYVPQELMPDDCKKFLVRQLS